MNTDIGMALLHFSQNGYEHTAANSRKQQHDDGNDQDDDVNDGNDDVDDNDDEDDDDLKVIPL